MHGCDLGGVAASAPVSFDATDRHPDQIGHARASDLRTAAGWSQTTVERWANDLADPELSLLQISLDGSGCRSVDPPGLYQVLGRGTCRGTGHGNWGNVQVDERPACNSRWPDTAKDQHG